MWGVLLAAAIGLSGGAGAKCDLGEIRFSYRAWEESAKRATEETFLGQSCSGLAYGYAIAVSDILSGSALACFPEGASYNQILDEVRKTISHNQGWIDETGTAIVIAKGLTETFPCKKKKF